MLDQDTDPYIGQAPTELQADTGLKGEQLFRVLDQLSGQVQEYLRNFPSKDSPRPEHTPMQKISRDGAEITLRLLGSGDFGIAYELNDGKRSYAFKVHREPDEGIMEDYFPEHSVYQEAANGMYLTTNLITKDVARFYASNPKQHWSLSEFILPTASVAERDGKTLKEVGLSMSDDGERNRVAHIRVDLGGEVKPLRTGSW